MKGAADLTDIVIEESDDMEHINAYFDIREAPLSKGDKAAVHVTAEEEDAAALLRGVIPEAGEQVFEIHAWKNVDDAADRAIGDIAVEAADIPTTGIFIIGSGRAIKLVHAESLRQEVRFWEVNGMEDRKHLRFRETVVDGDIPEGTGGHEGGADGKPCGDRNF